MSNNEKRWSKSDLALFVLVVAVCLMLPMFMGGLHATGAEEGTMKTLTDVFPMKTFRGSAEALKNIGALGSFLSTAISIFCFLGLAQTFYQKFITLLYLSSRNLFDTIYEVKMNKMQGKAAGLSQLFIQLFVNGDFSSKTGGGGLDVFITFIYGLLPNVKAYCDFSPDSRLIKNGVLHESMDVTQYMLKTAIPSICLVFFLTIGYSGTLSRSYQTVIFGMATALDFAVEEHLVDLVPQKVNGMENYQWTLRGLNSVQVDYARACAQLVYGKVMSQIGNADEKFKMNLIKVLENTMYGGGATVIVDDTTSIEGEIWGELGVDYVTAKFHPASLQSDFESSDSVNLLGILGGQHAGSGSNPVLDALITANIPDLLRDESFGKRWGSDNIYANLKHPKVFVTNSDLSVDGNTIVYSLDEIVAAALSGGRKTLEDVGFTETGLYVHIQTEINTNTFVNYNNLPIKHYVTGSGNGSTGVDSTEPQYPPTNLTETNAKRAAIVEIAYKYLNEQTEYGRIGYSMYRHSNMHKNGKGHWVGVIHEGSNYIRNSWYEPLGANASKFWLDCSSFVGKVYQEAGIGYTPSMTTVSWASSGKKISFKELKPGDILNISGSHVGLYIGNDTVIHCTGTGDTTQRGTVLQVTANYQQIKSSPLSKWMNYVPIRPAGLPD